MAARERKYTVGEICGLLDEIMRENMSEKAEYIARMGWGKASKAQLEAYANYNMAYMAVWSRVRKLANTK